MQRAVTQAFGDRDQSPGGVHQPNARRLARSPVGTAVRWAGPTTLPRVARRVPSSDSRTAGIWPRNSSGGISRPARSPFLPLRWPRAWPPAPPRTRRPSCAAGRRGVRHSRGPSPGRAPETARRIQRCTRSGGAPDPLNTRATRARGPSPGRAAIRRIINARVLVGAQSGDLLGRIGRRRLLKRPSKSIERVGDFPGFWKSSTLADMFGSSPSAL